MRKTAFVTKATLFLTMASVGFFQAVFLVPDTLAQAPGQNPAQPPTGKTDQPVDIQANSQEFAEDQIIATGNVKVTYKESIVRGPEARLFRDPSGQAQRAVFTGHPYLTQNGSKINSDTLIFEIANSKVVAQGHAHSEIISDGQDAQSGPTAGKAGKAGAPGSLGSVSQGAGGKPKINWPHDGGDEQSAPTTAPVSAVLPIAPLPSASTTADGTTAPTSTLKKPGDKDAVPTKIITDSDYQEYAKQDGQFEASGHVHVQHEDINVHSDKVSLVYGLDGKPETALFTGNVDATQKTNHTYSDMMTYYLQTKRLQATGNVRSKVIQTKPLEKKADPTNKKVVGAKPIGTAGGAQASQLPTGATAKKPEDDTILVVSDAQDYSRDSGRMLAEGNVHVYYQDTVGLGPKAVLYKNEETGKAEKVIFTGRSQITQTGKRWIADKITFTVANKKVLAEGNSRAFIFQAPTNDKKTDSGGNVASKPGPGKAEAGVTGSRNSDTALSASKVEATQ